MSCCYLLRFVAPSMHVDRGGNPYLVLHMPSSPNNTVLMKNEDPISKNLMVWFSTIAAKKTPSNQSSSKSSSLTPSKQSANIQKKRLSPSLNNHGLTSLLCVCQRYHYPLSWDNTNGIWDEVLCASFCLYTKQLTPKTANLVIKLQSIEASERIRGNTCTALKHDFYFQLSESTSLPSGLRFKFRFHVTF